MKASPLALPLLLAAVLGAAAWPPPAHAQDSVILQSGLTREGKVVGVTGGNIRLQINNAVTGIPLRDVREIRMDAPPAMPPAPSGRCK